MQLSFFTVEVPRATITLSEHFGEPAEVVSARALLFFESIAPDVREAVRARMRDGGRGEGAETERGNLQSLTIGGDSPSLVVFGDLPQTFADEFGRVPGSFPPWKQGSELYDWTLRHGLGQDITRGEARFLTPSEARAAGQLLGKGTAKVHREAVESHVESVSFLIARAIFTRGLPRPDDPLREPFAQTFSEFLPGVIEGLTAQAAIAAEVLNGVGVY